MMYHTESCEDDVQIWLKLSEYIFMKMDSWYHEILEIVCFNYIQNTSLSYILNSAGCGQKPKQIIQ